MRFTKFLPYVVNSNDGAANAVMRWTLGSLAGAKWESNQIMLVIALLGTLFFWTQHRTLNLMLLGDESAITLGTDLHWWRLLYLGIAALMIGFSVYVSGR